MSINIVHLTSSRFVGGPEWQMIELGTNLPDPFRTTYISFSEGGLCGDFLRLVEERGMQGYQLTYDTPRLVRACQELTDLLSKLSAHVVLCHGYKAGILGRLAARRISLPAYAVSRGWTSESLKVRFYEWLDRINLRWMDRVICVSDAQAKKVRFAGVDADRVTVIRDSVKCGDTIQRDPVYRDRLQEFFTNPPQTIIAAAGRLSPEKGFDVLLAAAQRVIRRDPGIGFVVFGEGRLRTTLRKQIEQLGLRDRFVLAGFHKDVRDFMACADLFVQSSFTEGLPNVVLEAFAAGIPVVATRAGGTAEIVQDAHNGYLVDCGRPKDLADAILRLTASRESLRKMGQCGWERVRHDFTFGQQCREYSQLLAGCRGNGHANGRA